MSTIASPDAPEQRAGEVSRVIPAVSIMRGGQSIAADSKAPIYWQDVVNTLSSGRARVALDDGSVVNLGSDSNLRVAKHDAGAQQTELAVGLGKNKPSGQPNVVIVASDVRITPVVSVASSGSVSADDPCNLLIQSQRGQLYVQVGSESQLVEPGKAFRVRPVSSVSEHSPTSPDADNYHESHQHQPCAGPTQAMKGNPPQAPAHSRFIYVAGEGVAILTIVPVLEALESPNHP